MESQRFLGIELGGSRRTAVVALDFFPREKKAFVAEIHSPLSALADESPDETLLRVVHELAPFAAAVDAPLTLPPCFACEEAACPGVRDCPRPAVRWMMAEAKRLRWARGKLPMPYAQRPVDLLLRGRWQEEAPFPVDDSFGASRAPLAARMRYLRRLLPPMPLTEAMPRLTLAGLASWYGLSARDVRRSRDVEDGVEHRMTLLEAMSQPPGRKALPHLFLYNSDIASLAQDLSAFDAFLCALMALADHLGLLEEPDFDPAWGVVAKPRKLK